jgi:hypothetical protein
LRKKLKKGKYVLIFDRTKIRRLFNDLRTLTSKKNIVGNHSIGFFSVISTEFVEKKRLAFILCSKDISSQFNDAISTAS